MFRVKASPSTHESRFWTLSVFKGFCSPVLQFLDTFGLSEARCEKFTRGYFTLPIIQSGLNQTWA